MTPATVITYDGTEQSIKEWALDYGITPGIIIGRLERGMPIGEAITTPMKVGHPDQQLPAFHLRQRKVKPRVLHVWPAPVSERHGPHISFDGCSLTTKEWADRLGITSNALHARIHRLGHEHAIALGGPKHRRQGDQAPGVVSNFAPVEGTGAGRLLQESTNITFSEKASTA